MPKNRIWKEKDGFYHYERIVDGRRFHIRSHVGELKSSFTRRCDQLDREAEGNVVDDTFDALFWRWIDEKVKINLSPSELRVSPNLYRRFIKPYLGSMKASEVTRADVYSVLARAQKQGCSAGYIKRIRSCISRPYNWAVNSLGLELTVPTQGLIFRTGRYADDDQPAPRDRAISDQDLERFMSAARNSKYLNYFKILRLCGLRPSEGLGLQVRDITQDELLIRRGITQDGRSPLKTRTARREIPMTPQLRSVLADQRARIAFSSRAGWLFPSSADDAMPSMNAVRCAFRRVLRGTEEWKTGGRNGMKKLKIVRPALQISLYDFRHTFATEMAQAGMNPTALQSILGHADISTTLRYYVEFTDEMKEKARELMSAL